MTAGRWYESADAIAFDVNGNLLSGQHRLFAVIKSGKNIVCDIKVGLPVESAAVIDTGRPRSPGDCAMYTHPDDVIYRDKAVYAVMSVISRYFGVMPRTNALTRVNNLQAIRSVGELHGVAKAVYYLKKKGIRAVGCKDAGFFTAAVLAMTGGAEVGTILDFISACEGNIPITGNYNLKVVMAYRDEHMRRGSHCVWSAPEQIRATLRAIYCFANNVRSTGRDEPYPVTWELLKMTNDKFEEMF